MNRTKRSTGKRNLTESKQEIEKFADSFSDWGAAKLAKYLHTEYNVTTQGRSVYSILSVIRRYRAGKSGAIAKPAKRTRSYSDGGFC